MEYETLMEYLEKLPVDLIESKLGKISEVKNRFLYDLNRTVSDAFSAMIETLLSWGIERLRGNKK